MKDIKLWIKGLLVAAIGGATTAAAQAASSYGTGQPIDGKVMGSVAASGAVLGVIAWLAKSPRQ